MDTQHKKLMIRDTQMHAYEHLCVCMHTYVGVCLPLYVHISSTEKLLIWVHSLFVYVHTYFLITKPVQHIHDKSILYTVCFVYCLSQFMCCSLLESSDTEALYKVDVFLTIKSVLNDNRQWQHVFKRIQYSISILSESL